MRCLRMLFVPMLTASDRAQEFIHKYVRWEQLKKGTRLDTSTARRQREGGVSCSSTAITYYTYITTAPPTQTSISSTCRRSCVCHSNMSISSIQWWFVWDIQASKNVRWLASCEALKCSVLLIAVVAAHSAGQSLTYRPESPSEHPDLLPQLTEN